MSKQNFQPLVSLKLQSFGGCIEPRGIYGVLPEIMAIKTVRLLNVGHGAARARNELNETVFARFNRGIVRCYGGNLQPRCFSVFYEALRRIKIRIRVEQNFILGM